VIKITIDDEVLKLTPRSKRIGKRLFWGWVSFQVFIITFVIGSFAFVVGFGLYVHYRDLEFDRKDRLGISYEE